MLGSWEEKKGKGGLLPPPFAVGRPPPVAAGGRADEEGAVDGVGVGFPHIALERDALVVRDQSVGLNCFIFIKLQNYKINDARTSLFS
jgi:hypothetical protein